MGKSSLMHGLCDGIATIFKLCIFFSSSWADTSVPDIPVTTEYFLKKFFIEINEEEYVSLLISTPSLHSTAA
jgi:hypothetical protein